MSTISPQIDRRNYDATPGMRGLMARYSQPSLDLCRVYTPQIGLNMGMDSRDQTPPITGPDFNNDFNSDWGPPT